MFLICTFIIWSLTFLNFLSILILFSVASGHLYSEVIYKCLWHLIYSRLLVFSRKNILSSPYICAIWSVSSKSSPGCMLVMTVHVMFLWHPVMEIEVYGFTYIFLDFWDIFLNYIFEYFIPWHCFFPQVLKLCVYVISFDHHIQLTFLLFLYHLFLSFFSFLYYMTVIMFF